MYGQEVYVKDLYINQISTAVDDGGFPDFNKIVLDSKDTIPADIDDAFDSFPMMSDKKLIIIKDSGIFQRANEEQKEYWQNRLENIPDYLIVIFDEKEVDKRSALFKKAAKIGFEIEFSLMESSQIVTWVERETMKAGKKISKDTAGYFVSICDEGMSNIKNELDKLIAYCDKDIGKSDVERIVSKAVGVRVFELTDCIMAKNADGALKTVRESAFKLLYLLSSSFDKMLYCLLLLSEGENYSDISSKAKIAPFLVKKYINSARCLGENFLTERIMQIADYDLAIKNGEIGEWEALEKFVTDSCQNL